MMKITPHACGVDDIAAHRHSSNTDTPPVRMMPWISFPDLFPVWVTSTKPYRITLAKHRRIV
jgi:hypothetical protein